MASTSSRKKKRGHSPIVQAKQILNWQNIGTKTLANGKRKKSPIEEKCFKRAKSDAMEVNNSNSSSSEHGSDNAAMFTESSTSVSYDSESEIEKSRHYDSDNPEDSVFIAPVEPSFPSFNTPEKEIVSDAKVASDCPKRPVKPKRVSSSRDTGSPNGKPQTSTPIREKDGFSKFPADLSEVPTTERSAAKVEQPVGNKPYSPRTRRRILQELPDKYPMCKVDKLKYRKPPPAEMTILKRQVQFLRSHNTD